MTPIQRKPWVARFAALVACATVPMAFATSGWAQQVHTDGAQLPGPEQVWGKEYATFADGEALWSQKWGKGERALSYEQAVQFGSDIDALANSQDALYIDLVQDEAYMLFNVGNESLVRWEAPKVAQQGGWGTPPGSRATDALEVWGPHDLGEVLPDANLFSLRGDASGTSIFGLNLGTGAVAPWISREQIALAIGLDQRLIGQVDVDALVAYGSNLVFSVAPIEAAGLDGGEIWHWQLSDPSGRATFLRHGGHLWDTAFDVRGTYGLHSEDVTVLEVVAVPEPHTQALALVGLGLMACVLRRRRNN